MQKNVRIGLAVIIGVVILFIVGTLALHFGEKAHDRLAFDLGKEFPKDKPFVPGEILARTLIEIMKHELNGAFGWRPNDFFLWGPGLWADNNANRQIGIIHAIRESTRVFKDNLTKVSPNVYDQNLVEADTMFRNDERKLWFPSAESRFKKGVEALEKYIKGLHATPPTSRPLNQMNSELMKLFEAWTDLLGDAHANLYRTREPDGSLVHMWRTDDYFYQAQGYVHVMYYVMQAIDKEYGETIKESARALFPEVLDALKKASTLKPLIILDGCPEGIFANHRRNLDGYISEARSKMFSIHEELQSR
jgi:hypothetical protein